MGKEMHPKHDHIIESSGQNTVLCQLPCRQNYIMFVHWQENRSLKSHNKKVISERLSEKS